MSRGSGARKRTERQGQTIQPKGYEREVSEEAKSSDAGREEKTEINEDGRYSQCRRGRRP